ncbi:MULTISPECIES: DUF485 domain-containing protein [Cupriavidus]|uniref:DUF485 domain-containing protein n=1 Tax=Cupriavidus sp. DF5525 TaxID=3160989 RepID=UPI0003B0C46D|nr:hypothetical protein N234_22570 [Ralstonia pickettii DTP0602]
MQDSTTIARIRRHPRFAELARRRARLSCGLLVLVLGPYLALMLAVAAAPHVLGRPLHASGMINLGIALAIGVILLGWLATWFYVHRANGVLEALVGTILQEARQ